VKLGVMIGHTNRKNSFTFDLWSGPQYRFWITFPQHRHDWDLQTVNR